MRWRWRVGISAMWALVFAAACGESSRADSSSASGAGGTAAAGAATGGAASGSAGASQGGSQSGAGGGSPDSVPLDGLGDAYARAECAYLERCSYETLIFSKFAGGCAGLYAPSIEDHLVARIARAIDSGRAAYDPRAMAECLARLASADCAENIVDCEEAIEGTVPAGGDCLTNFECAGDARCSAGEPIDQECSRWICVPRGELGTCPCAPGFSCRIDELGNETCEAHLEEGATCTTDGPPCRGSLACTASAAGGPTTCRRFEDVALGEACDMLSRRCSPEGRCMIVSGTSEGDFDYRCVPVAPSGGTCHIGLLDDCPANEYCPLAYADLAAGRHTATCQPSVADGEACNREYSAMCRIPGTCSGAGLCEPHGRLGDECSVDDECTSERCFDGICVLETPC